MLNFSLLNGSLTRLRAFKGKRMKTRNTMPMGPSSEAMTELETLSKRRHEVILGIKTSLADFLTKAASQLKLLRAEGVENILADNQFTEACNVLGIDSNPDSIRTRISGGERAQSVTRTPRVTRTAPKAAKAPRAASGKIISFEDAIRKALSDGRVRNVEDIYKRVQKLKGEDVSRDTMLAVLSVVKSKGQITNPARGQWQKTGK